jgi:hypothetical protein
VRTPRLGYVTRDECELAFADIFGQINASADTGQGGQPGDTEGPAVIPMRRPNRREPALDQSGQLAPCLRLELVVE